MLEQEYRSLQRLMEIAELRQKGIQDTHLLDWNFRVAEYTPYVQMGKRYVNNWQQVKAENLGLLFWGDVGTGKSFLAACIANGLLDQGVSVMMTNFTRILNKLSDLQVKERSMLRSKEKTSSVLFGSILWAKGIPKKIFRLSLRVRKSIVPESNLPWQKRNGHSIFCLSLMIKFGQKAPDISGGQPITILSRWRRPESFSKSMALTPWMSCVRKQAPLPQTSTELTKS